jgi:hypothetical protein
MAEGSFDANVPAMQDSNWLFFSRPGREQPRGNESGKIIGEAVGKALDTGAKEADHLMEDHVRDTVFDVEQRNREQFIGAAQNLAEDKGVQRPDLLNTGQTNLQSAPPAVKSAVQKVQTVQGAMEAGKLDKYGYYQRVIPELQAVRQQYPGYRSVVDQALGNNANAYMNTLISEINRKDSENREDRRRQQTEVFSMAKDGFFGVNGAAVVNAFNSNKIDMSTILKTAAPYMARSAQAKSAQQDKEVFEWNKLEQSDKMSTEAEKQFSSNTAGGMTWPSVAAGQSEPVPDADIAKLKTRNVTPEDNLAINQRLQSHYNEVYQQNWAWATTPWANGQTPLQTLGEEKVKGLINAHLAPLKAWIDFSGDPKNFTLADNLKNITKMSQEGTMAALFNNPDEKIRQTVRASYAAKELLGPEGMAMASTYIPGGLNGFMKTVMTTDLIHAIGGVPDPTKNNATPSLGDQIETLKKAGITDPVSYKGHIQMVSMITDPKVPDAAKTSMARFAFQATKENRDWLSNIQSGHYENGRWHDGAEEVLRDLTDPRLTKYIMKTGDAKLASDYQGTTDALFRIVAQRNIAQLNDALTTTPPSPTLDRRTGKPVSDETGPKIQLQWDTEHNMPDLTPESRRSLMQTTSRGILNSYNRLILDSVTRLQRYTGNMAKILETVKEAGYPRDIRTYMLRLLQDEGLNIKDLPASQQLQKAIEATAPTKKVSEE